MYEERPIYHSNVMLYSNKEGVTSRVGKQCAPRGVVSLAVHASQASAAAGITGCWCSCFPLPCSPIATGVLYLLGPQWEQGPAPAPGRQTARCLSFAAGQVLRQVCVRSVMDDGTKVRFLRKTGEIVGRKFEGQTVAAKQ